MNIKYTGDRAETVRLTVRNDEASASLAVGDPVCYSIDGTEDGLAVELPSSSSAANSASFFAGIVTKGVGQALPKVAEVQAYGLCRKAKLIFATRSATNATWNTLTWAVGDQGIVQTVHNAISRSGAGAASAAGGMIICAETAAMSYLSVTRASDDTNGPVTSLSATVWTGYAKVFLRAL